MDNENNPKYSSITNEISGGERQNGREAHKDKAKVLATVFCVTTIAAVGTLAYIIVTSEKQKSKLNSDLKASRIEIQKSNEIISKYEDATKTKVEEIKEDNTTIKEIVKPAVYDVKYQQLLNLMGSDKFILKGEIFTNKGGTYVFASLQVGGINKEKDNLGNEISVLGGGGGVEEYYRELPNGDWKFAFRGQMIKNCSEFSAEIRKIYHEVERPDGQNNYSCMVENDINKTEHL